MPFQMTLIYTHTNTLNLFITIWNATTKNCVLTDWHGIMWRREKKTEKREIKYFWQTLPKLYNFRSRMFFFLHSPSMLYDNKECIEYTQRGGEASMKVNNRRRRKKLYLGGMPKKLMIGSRHKRECCTCWLGGIRKARSNRRIQ